MERIKDEFLEQLGPRVPLAGKVVAEIGCGNGGRSITLAPLCLKFFGVEPNKDFVGAARRRNIPNATFEVGTGEAIPLADDSVDVTIFALSLHHVPVELMAQAINEALRVTRKSGYIVFLEPTEEGSFFDAEIHFDICDGDERTEKRAAKAAILNHPGLRILERLACVTAFKVHSATSFCFGMDPKKNAEELEGFLTRNGFILDAHRVLFICQAA